MPYHDYDQEYDEDSGGDCRTLSTTQHKARKLYQCQACDCAINPGTEYQRMVWVFDGEFDYMRIHKPGDCVHEPVSAVAMDVDIPY